MATYTYRFQMRRDSAADWTSNTPTLAEGELGYETDTGKIKVGNGSTTWTSLSYFPTGNMTFLDDKYLYFGTGSDGRIYASSDNLYIANNTADKDIIIKTVDSDISSVASEMIRIDASVSRVSIQDSGPDATFTINHLADDGRALSFKNSDIAHGRTTMDETDTYTSFRKIDNTGGGLLVRSYTDGDETTKCGLQLQVFVGGTADTTTTTAGRGLIELYATEHDKADGYVNVATAGNIFVVRDYTGGAFVTQFIIKGNGDICYNASAATYDGEIDALACHDLSQVVSNNFDKVLQYSKDKLVKLGVMSDGGFMSVKNSTMLELGAIGELYKIVSYLLNKMGLTYEDIKKELQEAN